MQLLLERPIRAVAGQNMVLNLDRKYEPVAQLKLRVVRGSAAVLDEADTKAADLLALAGSRVRIRTATARRVATLDHMDEIVLHRLWTVRLLSDLGRLRLRSQSVVVELLDDEDRRYGRMWVSFPRGVSTIGTVHEVEYEQGRAPLAEPGERVRILLTRPWRPRWAMLERVQPDALGLFVNMPARRARKPAATPVPSVRPVLDADTVRHLLPGRAGMVREVRSRTVRERLVEVRYPGRRKGWAWVVVDDAGRVDVHAWGDGRWKHAGSDTFDSVRNEGEVACIATLDAVPDANDVAERATVKGLEFVMVLARHADVRVRVTVSLVREGVWSTLAWVMTPAGWFELPEKAFSGDLAAHSLHAQALNTALIDAMDWLRRGRPLTRSRVQPLRRALVAA